MGLQRSAIASAVIAGAVIMAGAIAGAGSQGGLDLGGIPVMVLAAAIAFVVQWFAFLPAYWKQTEQFYDLVGSLTYLLVTGFVLVASRPIDARSAILGLLVFIWASRLGSFLFRRVRTAGSDPRFDDIKPSASRFLVARTLQGLWVGVAMIAGSTLRGWQWVTMISPVFVLFLLSRVSGIPLLEKRADQRWGDYESYRRYKAGTPVLVPRRPRR